MRQSTASFYDTRPRKKYGYPIFVIDSTFRGATAKALAMNNSWHFSECGHDETLQHPKVA
jgi:hypothetical protein